MNPTDDHFEEPRPPVLNGELGELYRALWQEVAGLHVRWAHFVGLFGTSEERIALLNASASSIFRTVQDALWEALLLHLARLTDPPETARKPNLTIRRLVGAVANTPIEEAVRVHTDAALSACEFARDWRNRRLAHRDLDLATGKEAEPLAPTSRQAVKLALGALSRLLNLISQHHLNYTTRFEYGLEDAEVLVGVLRDGLSFRADRLARLKTLAPPVSTTRPDPP